MTSITGPNTYHFTVTDLNSIIREQLRTQQQLFRQALKRPGLDKLTKIHLKEMDMMISQKFNAESSGLLK